MQVWRNCQVLSEQTSNSSAFLIAMYRLKYVSVLNYCTDSISHVSIRINCNRISDGLL
jgi:hypothetical protein